jgi:hypothetical protein
MNDEAEIPQRAVPYFIPRDPFCLALSRNAVKAKNGCRNSEKDSTRGKIKENQNDDH